MAVSAEQPEAGHRIRPGPGEEPGAAVLVDTHAHLDDPRFDEDLDSVLRRAREAGVHEVVTCGSSLASSRRAVAIARRYRQADGPAARVWAAVGVHPHEAMRAGDLKETLQELRRLAGCPEVVAVGEVGLDYHYGFAPPVTQQRVLARQLELALELDLPVILHTREAVEDVLRLVEVLGVRSGVLHAFAGTSDQAWRALSLGLHLGVGGMLTFKNAESLRQLVATLPPDRLVLETDAPYLAPVPYRGQRNEPARVAEVATWLARLFRRSPQQVAASTTASAGRLFKGRLDSP